MRRIKSIFSSLVLTFAMLGCFGLGMNLVLQDYENTNFASAAETNDAHSLREFVKLSHENIDEKLVMAKNSQNVDYVYFMQNSSSFEFDIATDKVDGQDENGESATNYAYKQEDSTTYDYFQFTNIGLFKDINKGQINDSHPEDNLLGSYNNSFTTGGGFEAAGVTPSTLRVQFKLNTSASIINVENIKYNPEGGEIEPAVVTLKDEGLYTLRVAMTVYHMTTDSTGKATVSSSETPQVDFTFMVFNNTTYLTNNLPKISYSNATLSNLQQGSTYSRYYFHNYNSKGLPTIKYDPERYALKVGYTDQNNTLHSSNVNYDYNTNSVEISEDFFYATYEEASDNQNARITFENIGEYNLTFDYIYIAKDSNTVYNIPLETDLERLCVFGYQSFYTDLSNAGQATEFKSFNEKFSEIENSADVSYLLGNALSDASNKSVDDSLAKTILDKINEQAAFTIASTNQSPVRFASNVKEADGNSSMIWKLENKDNKWSIVEGSGKKFDWLAMNSDQAGTYLIIAKYTYANYLDNNGFASTDQCHLQAFLFKIDNLASNASVYIKTEKNDVELVSDGDFTNRDVYVVDNASNQDFNSKPRITISGVNYTTGAPLWDGEKELNDSLPNISYQHFNGVGNDIDGKNGILISAADGASDGRYTVNVYQPGETVPTIMTFTIDTSDVGNIKARNVKYVSNNTYLISTDVGNHVTTGPMVFSWPEKSSGAPTNGYVKYYPLKSVNFYPQGDNSTLLTRLLTKEIDLLPVDALLDLNPAVNPQWTYYQNTNSYQNTLQDKSSLNSEFVRSAAGLYIVEVFDSAGNANFDVFFIDNTSPIMIQKLEGIDGASDSLKVLSNSSTVAISDAYNEVTIAWASKKGIYINGDVDANNSTLYANDPLIDGITDQTQLEKLTNALNDFFKRVTKLTGFANSNVAGNHSINGNYLAINVNEEYYFKDDVSNGGDYFKQNGKENSIPFFDANKNPIERTYYFLLRDESNYNGLNEYFGAELYKNYPSTYLSINITSDSSRTAFTIDQNGTLASGVAGYSYSGKFYTKQDGETTQFAKTKNDETEDFTQSSQYAYKNSYYKPIKAQDSNGADLANLYLSFIPVSQNGNTTSYVDSVTLYYYPFVTATTEDISYQQNQYGFNGTTQATFYTLSQTPSPASGSPLFKRSTSNEQESNKMLYINIAQTTSRIVEPGMYVVVRRYSLITNDNTIDQYDYYERTLTLIVDKFNVISKLETVKDEAGNTSAESIVGGDILVSMFSNDYQSDVTVSFPYLDSNGLNNGSLYSADSTSGTLSSRFTTNKLPLTINVPSVKYTTNYTYDNDNNSYSVEGRENTRLTRFAESRIEAKTDGSGYDVYVKDLVDGNEILIDTFTTAEEAAQYVESTKITEYNLSVVVTLTANDGVHTYRSNGSSTNGYLNLYEIIDGALNTNSVATFNRAGTYVVAISQASSQTSSEGFGNTYRFQFVVEEPKPDFDVYSNGKLIESIMVSDQTQTFETYFVNSPSIRVTWPEETNASRKRLMAKIDTNSIMVNGEQIQNNNKFILEGNSLTFDISEVAADAWNNQGDITISMRLEGYDDGQQHTAIKRIRVDTIAPSENLDVLMNGLMNAYAPFDKLLQQKEMRTHFGYDKNEIDSSRWTDANLNDQLLSVSYSFSKSGDSTLKNYAYNVPASYFSSLHPSLSTAGAQHYYIKQINDIKTYTQVNINSFSPNNYNDLFETYSVLPTVGDYYEVVETDYAGNMVVYVVHVVGNDGEVLSYSNSDSDNVLVTTEQINENENIFSSSGFKLKTLNYLTDDWGIYTTQIFQNETSMGVSRTYMKSPYLDNGYIYLLDVTNRKITLTPMLIESLYSSVNSSPLKQRLVMTDRFNGENTKTLYLTIWNGSSASEEGGINIVDKYSDEATATLTLRVPSAEQIASDVRSYIYPVEITIYQYDSQRGEWKNDWIYHFENVSGDPALWQSSGAVKLSYLQPNLTITTNILQTEKLKYVFVDNFGHTTTEYQIANEDKIANEVGGMDIYKTSSEPDQSTTYLSSNDLNYNYNNQIYEVEVRQVNIVNGIEYEEKYNLTQANHSATPNHPTIMRIFFFKPSSGTYDNLYRIYLFDIENDFAHESASSQSLRENADKIVQIRLYNNLPIFNENGSTGIWFRDKNNKYISGDPDLETTQVNVNGISYSAIAQNLNTYSSNVTVYFNPSPTAYPQDYSYRKQYSYSVWWKPAEGSWQNITENNLSGFRLNSSGLVLVHYDDSSVFQGKCLLFNVNILTSSSLYYYITAQGSDGRQTTVEQAKDFNDPSLPLRYHEYDENGNMKQTCSEVYLVSVSYNTNDRVKINPNEELGVKIRGINTDGSPEVIRSSFNDVVVVIYTYYCDVTSGRFAIIYIGNPNQISSVSVGSNIEPNEKSLTEDTQIVRNEDAGSKLRVTFNDYYGITENKIHVTVMKLFDSEYVEIAPQIYSDGTFAYFYLDRTGTYQLSFYDSCQPRNVQHFGSSTSVTLLYLIGVPYHIIYTDENGQTVESEPLDRAVYNSNVVVSLQNLSTYYNSYDISIVAFKNGQTYTGYERNGYNYTFSEPGYYQIGFSGAKYKNGDAIRLEMHSFTILDANESTFSYEIARYSTGSNTYYIQQVIKDGIALDLNELNLDDAVTINGKTYLERLLLSVSDLRSGPGRYTITISTGLDDYANIVPSTFTFSLWINRAKPPYTVSISRGNSTTKPITVKFNSYHLYETIGSCYIQIGSMRYNITADTLADIGGENATITINQKGTYYVQFYTMSGKLIDSYKIIKKEPLNTWAIIAIVIGVAAVVAVVVITILLRKKLRVK